MLSWSATLAALSLADLFILDSDRALFLLARGVLGAFEVQRYKHPQWS